MDSSTFGSFLTADSLIACEFNLGSQQQAEYGLIHLW